MPLLLSVDGRVCRMMERPPQQLAVGLLMLDEPQEEWPLPLALYALADRDDQNRLMRALATGGLRLNDLHLMADGVVREWFRQPRWTARAIWREFLDNYSRADGDLLLAGVDLETLPVHRATNVLLSLFVKWYRHDEDAMSAFIQRCTLQPRRLTELGGSTTAQDAARSHDALMSAAGMTDVVARGAPNLPPPADDGGSVLTVRG